MRLRTKLPSHFVNIVLSGSVLLFLLTMIMAIWLSPPPRLVVEYRDQTIDISADRAWTLFPGDCLLIRWELRGEQSIYIEGIERHEPGSEEFCPAIFAPSPKIELTDHFGGDYRSYSLSIQHLPDFLANLFGVALLPFFGLLALFYLWRNDIKKQPSFRALIIATVALLLCIALLRLTGKAATIVGVLAFLRNLFLDLRWMYSGALLIPILYGPLLMHVIWQGVKNRRFAELAAAGGLLLFVGMLYLPFGFDTIGHWEEWFGRAYLEGFYRQRLYTEISQRYWIVAPHTAAALVSWETFHGFNLLYAGCLWGKLILLYGVLRQFNVNSLYAFLITTLFAVYPADAGLMYLRSISPQFSALTLLTACYLILAYKKKQSRAYLAGIWLALALAVGLYEAHYMLIVVLPLIWWISGRALIWRKINLVAIWYLVPALKIAYMLLILVTQRGFYRSNYVYQGEEIAFGGLIPRTIANVIEVYRQSFVNGWSEAIAALGRNTYLPLTLIMLAMIGGIAWFLWNSKDGEWVPTFRQMIRSLAIGLLLILPSVGVLIWIGYYSRDLWRLYLYVPGPAAIALFSLLALLTTPIRRTRHRTAVLVALCLLLTLPAISRLFLQHEHYVTSANNKRRILEQIVQLAPELGNQTRVLVLSQMSDEDFQQKHIEEMKSNMIGNAMYVLYGKNSSGRGSLCTSVSSCYPLRDWDGHLKDTIVFTLAEDLSLSLIEEPSTFIPAFEDLEYDVTALYDSDAPLPTRAFTMLGLSTR